MIELTKWRWGVERRGRGSNFFPHGVEKEVGGGRILSSFIEERGKSRIQLSIWCKSFIRNLFKRSSQCLSTQYLHVIIISSVGVIEIQVIINPGILNTFKVFCILYFVALTKVICIL